MTASFLLLMVKEVRPELKTRVNQTKEINSQSQSTFVAASRPARRCKLQRSNASHNEPAGEREGGG